MTNEKSTYTTVVHRKFYLECYFERSPKELHIVLFHSNMYVVDKKNNKIESFILKYSKSF